MAQIPVGLLKNFTDGQYLHGSEVNQALEILRTAHNATDDGLTNSLNSVNGAIANVNTLVTNTIYTEPYNAATQYQKNNVVTANGGSYIAKRATMGNAPTGLLTDPNWGLLASNGSNGTGFVTQSTPPVGIQEGRLWLDTSENAYQGTVFDALNTTVITHTQKLARLDTWVVDVTNFGAKGDWNGTTGTDDTAAIQAAIDSVITKASGEAGAIVFFPAGVYLISDSIKLYGNMTIKGVGRRGSTILLKANSSAVAMLHRVGNGTTTYWTQIRDICLDGQASQQTFVAADGIKLENVTECFIHNVGIRFVRGHGIHLSGELGQPAIQPTIRDCLIRADINNHAIGACGILLDNGSYDGMLSGNDIGFYKQGYGIELNGHNGAFLSDNNVWQCKNGYYLNGANRIRLANNLSDYAQEHGYFVSGSSELQFSNCQSRWSSNKVSSYQIYDGFHLYSSSDIVMDGCAILGGNGVDLIDGGTGQTAYGVAMTGTTHHVRIGAYLTKLVKGDFYKDVTTSDLTVVSTVAI